jgi:hypothetical protein
MARTTLEPLGKAQLRQSNLRGGGPWLLDHPELGAVLADLERRHSSFRQSITCHLGVKTGLNRVFLSPPTELESQVIRWALRGRDVKAFSCRPRLRLLWTCDQRGRPVAHLPPKARAYLERHQIALSARVDLQGGPAWTLFRTRAAVARYRVVWPDLAPRLMAAALTRKSELMQVPLNSCYVAPVRSAAMAHALAGWLNSTWMRAIAMQLAVPAAGGFFRFNAGVLNRLPLPPAALRDSTLARLGHAARRGKSVQVRLDAVVAHHLGLSSRARRALRAALDTRPIHHR